MYVERNNSNLQNILWRHCLDCIGSLVCHRFVKYGHHLQIILHKAEQQCNNNLTIPRSLERDRFRLDCNVISNTSARPAAEQVCQDFQLVADQYSWSSALPFMDTFEKKRKHGGKQALHVSSRNQELRTIEW